MKNIVLFIVMAASTSSWAAGAIVNKLRADFQNASSASLANLDPQRTWDCRGVIVSDNDVFNIKMNFKPYDGLIQTSIHIQTVNNGHWLAVDEGYASTTSSMTLPNELVREQRRTITGIWFGKPVTIDETHAFRVKKNGDLLVEVSTKVVSGEFAPDPYEKLPSLVVSGNRAGEYWVCPK